MNPTIPHIAEALAHSVIYEEYKGDLAQARQIAETQITAARRGEDPSSLADALLARGVVHLLQGEQPGALRCFQEIEETVPNDYNRRLRAVSYANLATFWHYNLFPDGSGASAAEIQARWDGQAYLQAVMPHQQQFFAASNDPYARFESSLVKDFLASLQAPRAFLQTGRHSGAGIPMEQLLPTALQTPIGFQQTAQMYVASPTLLAYADLAAADLCQRAGDLQTGFEFLRRALATYDQSSDPAGVACAQMLWGDWQAAPFSTPRVWNFAIQDSNSSGSYLAWTWEAAEFSQQGANLEEAAAAYDESERLFRLANAPRGVAHVFLRRAYLAVLRGEWNQAGQYITQAQAALEASGDQLGFWLAKAQSALIGIGAGQFPEDQAAAQAIGSWGASQGSFSYTLGLGLLLGRTGRHWLLREGDYERALACYRLAETLYEHLGAKVNHAQSLADLGTVYQSIGARVPAVTMYEQALDRYEADAAARPAVATRVRPQVIMLAADVYQLYLQEMDPDGMQRSAARMQTQLNTMPGEGGGLGMMAQMLSSGLAGLMSGGTFDATTAGVENYALSQLASSFIEQASVLVPLYRARQARDDGDEARAEQLFAQARMAAQSTSPALRDFLEAQVYAHQKAYPEARQAFQRYLEQGGANAGFVGQLASLMQTAGGQQGQLEAARQQQRTLEQAFTFMVRVKAFSEARGYLVQLEQLGGQDWWQQDPRPWQILSDCGELYEGLADLETALVYYDRAIQELEKRRTLLSRDELKTALAADKGSQYLYFQAARTALEMARSADEPEAARSFNDQAYGYAERGKARALLDLMVGSAGLAGTRLKDRQNVRAWRETNAKLTLWRGLLAQERNQQDPDQAKIAALQDSIENEEKALYRVERQLAESDPGFYHTLNPQAQILSLESVPKLLPPDTALLQYYYLGEDLLAWVITSQGDLKTHRARVDTSSLNRQILAFQRACESGVNLNGLGDPLSELFLEPFQEFLAKAKALIIVPYGTAHLLPFHVLPWQDGKPLAQTHVISYLPSASVLQFRQPGDALPDSILAVGDPANMAYMPPLGGRKRSARRLPAAGTEAAYVASLFPHGETLIGPQATEETVRAKLSQFPILHFATHGRLSEEAPMLSSILLADGQELSLYELMGMQLSAELVVLSACRTGVGETTGGDDVLGLTRGLLGAGARAAVVSLWPVDDLSTSLLMGEFYRQLLKGEPPASALHTAQKTLRELPADQVEAKTAELGAQGFVRDVDMDDNLYPPKDCSHPHHWAPFILVG